MLQTPGVVYANPKIPTLPHGAVTVRRAEPAAELEPAWNGALERSGAAAGLSGYRGQSSIYHSPAWPAELKHGDCRKIWRTGPKAITTEAQRVRIRELLRVGLSLRRVAKAAGVGLIVVRRQQAVERARERA